MNPNVEHVDACFVHGIGGSASDFDALRAYLPSHWRSESVALPGHERAHVDDDREPAGLRDGDAIESIVELVVASMPSRAGESSRASSATTVLVGHSTGGVLLLDAVGRGRSTPDALIIIDANVPVDHQAREHKRRKAVNASRHDWWRFFVSSVAGSIGDHVEPATRTAIEANILRVSTDVIRTIWRAVLSYDATQAWATCPCPVLYVRTTRALSAGGLAKLRSRPGTSDAPAEVLVLPAELGHYPHLTDPARVAGAITAFVSKHECVRKGTVGP